MGTEPRELGATDLPPALGERGRNCISAASTPVHAPQAGAGRGTKEEEVIPP